jgi:hypothetical protein
MDVIKIAINRDYGSFDLSDEAYSFIAKKKGWQHACNDYDRSYFITDENKEYVYANELSRDDPHLIQCIETLGEAVNGHYSDIKIVEIPSDVDWIIGEYDGMEWVAERHRTWQ